MRPLFLDTWTRLAPILRRLATRLPGESALHYSELDRGRRRVHGARAARPRVRRRAHHERSAPHGAHDRSLAGGGTHHLQRGGRSPSCASCSARPRRCRCPSSSRSADDLPMPTTSCPKTRRTRGARARSRPPRRPSRPPSRRCRTRTSAVRRFGILLVAAVKPARNLDRWVPTHGELARYLPRVREMLGATALRTQREKVLAGQHAEAVPPLVLTTAWQESCWRQFVRKGGEPQPLTSSVGAVGIMQVNPHVWRGIYDVKSLRSSTEVQRRGGQRDPAPLPRRLRDQEEGRPGAQDARRPRARHLRRLQRWPAPARSLPARVSEGQDRPSDRRGLLEEVPADQRGNDLAVKACFPGLET